MHGSNKKSRGPERYYNGQDSKRYHLPSARSEIFLALDYALRRLGREGSWWRHVGRQLNWIHLPAPAIRVYPDWRFYLLYL